VEPASSAENVSVLPTLEVTAAQERALKQEITERVNQVAGGAQAIAPPLAELTIFTPGFPRRFQAGCAIVW
jgi:hypothetical protein